MIVSKDYCDMPSSIFHSQELCHLQLYRCNLIVPPTFKGFHNLLVLYQSYLFCPLLETLALEVFRVSSCLNIHAPNLPQLRLHGEFQDVSLGSSPHLTEM